MKTTITVMREHEGIRSAYSGFDRPSGIVNHHRGTIPESSRGRYADLTNLSDALALMSQAAYSRRRVARRLYAFG